MKVTGKNGNLEKSQHWSRGREKSCYWESFFIMWSLFVMVCLVCNILLKKKKKGKTQIQFLRLGTLDSPLEFKYMLPLTNETQTMLFFSRIFKINVFEFN